MIRADGVNMRNEVFQNHNTLSERRTKAFRNAKFHTFFVRFLRLFLPVLAISATSLYFFYSKFAVVWNHDNGQASVKDIKLTKQSLKMINPKYRGFDEKNGSYIVQAEYALQNIKTPHVFQLHKVSARVDNKQKQWLELLANKGTYDNNKKKLRLHSQIDIKTSTQMYAILKSADMDLNKRTITGQGPVKVGMPNGTVYAEKVRIFPSQNRLLFQDKVQLHISKLPQSSDPKNNKRASSMFSNKNEPIDVAAQSLEINDKKRFALFHGQVSAVQSDMTLQAQKLRINYRSNGRGNPLDQANGNGSQQISSVEAQEEVLLTSGEGRYVSAGYTKFDNDSQKVTLVDNVKVSQGKNTLTGKKLIIDLKKRHSSFPPGGRVFGQFTSTAKPKKNKVSTEPQKNDSQSLSQAFAGGAGANSGPLSVYANSLDIYDQKKVAIFNGNVEVKRGGNSIRSGRLVLEYTGNTPVGGQTQSNSRNSAQVKKIVARKKVLIRTAHNQKVTSDRAVFDVPKEIVTIDGNVVLSQGKNVLKGNKLVINLRTGKYNFVNQTAKSGTLNKQNIKGNDGRVRVMIIPGTVQKPFDRK